MQKTFNAIIISTNKETNSVCIQQPVETGDNANPQIYVTLDQIPILIDWLEQAKTELETAST